MSITVQYGPISRALGLAQVAGAGAGYNIQAQRDLQAIGLQNQIQNSINSNDANLIQMAMQRDAAAQQQQQAAEAQHQREVAQQAQAQQQAQELALRQRQLEQQGAQSNAAEQTREEQAKALVAQRAQELKDKQAKEAWLSTLTPDQKNAVLSGAGLPVAKPGSDQPSPNAAATDDRQRAEKALDALKFKAEQDQNSYMKLSTSLLPDPAKVAEAQKTAQASMSVYQTAAQNITGPANVAGFSAAPVNTPAANAPAPQPALAPTGPSPFGVGGRKQMPDGSVWTWNGVSWTKG